MKFIDEARIRVAGGHGGPGAVAFRRETFVPRGGPAGGDGGAGGEVIFFGSVQLGSLQDLRYKREYKALPGDHGSGANKAGRDGLSIRVGVPIGTLIKDAESGEVLVDFAEDGQEWVAAEGGRGGKGNAHFVSSTFQAPKFAQPGEEGKTRDLHLELKLLADVGIIGYPNAGKSTLISRISAAKPKIADYPFTTLVPNLGVVTVGDYRTFVVADIPGLVEGAHRGEGLGHRFLKHIERTRIFVHLLDGTRLLGENGGPDLLAKSYQTIRNELGKFSEKLLHKPEVIVINKADAVDAEELEKARIDLRARIAGIRGTHPSNGEPFVISAVSGQGLDALLEGMVREMDEHKASARPPRAVRLPNDEDIRR